MPRARARRQPPAKVPHRGPQARACGAQHASGCRYAAVGRRARGARPAASVVGAGAEAGPVERRARCVRRCTGAEPGGAAAVAEAAAVWAAAADAPPVFAFLLAGDTRMHPAGAAPGTVQSP